MQTNFQLTTKQAEFIRNAHHRWNVASGAVRSGKSYCQISYCIPSRLIERRGKRGLRVILGATRSNIERNVLQPMRDIFGNSIATNINSQNYCKILGEKVYCIGADNIRQVAKIRGSEIAYCAIDEATDINQEVFEMLKSRLSLPWSICDITTNPASPNHWFKQFLESVEQGVDIFCQDYTIYDNPFLTKDYIRSLEAEYQGTVYFDRYILGKWTRAEGLIYPMFLTALGEPPEGKSSEVVLSLDYGTQNAFAALLWEKFDGVWYATREYYYSGRESGIQKTDEEYANDLEVFLKDKINEAYENQIYSPFGGESYPDTIPVIIDPSAASFIALLRHKDYFSVRPADNDVANGIRETASAMKTGRIKISPRLKHFRAEVEGYVWDDTLDDKPVKIDDHLMDSMRYFVRTKRISQTI